MGLGQSAVVIQTSTTVANTLPAGGAFGVGVTAAMLNTWGFTAGEITLFVGVTGIWNIFVKLGLPIVALGLLVATGHSNPGLAAAAAVGLVVLAAIRRCLGGEHQAGVERAEVARQLVVEREQEQRAEERGAEQQRRRGRGGDRRGRGRSARRSAGARCAARGTTNAADQDARRPPATAVGERAARGRREPGDERRQPRREQREAEHVERLAARPACARQHPRRQHERQHRRSAG